MEFIKLCSKERKKKKYILYIEILCSFKFPCFGHKIMIDVDFSNVPNAYINLNKNKCLSKTRYKFMEITSKATTAIIDIFLGNHLISQMLEMSI